MIQSGGTRVPQRRISVTTRCCADLLAGKMKSRCMYLQVQWDSNSDCISHWEMGMHTGHSPTSDQRVLGCDQSAWWMVVFICFGRRPLEETSFWSSVVSSLYPWSLIVVVSFKLLWCLVWGRTLRRNSFSVKLFGSLLPITPVTHLSTSARYEGNNWLRSGTSCVNVCIILKVCITTVVTPMILADELCLRKQSEWLKLYEKQQ